MGNGLSNNSIATDFIVYFATLGHCKCIEQVNSGVPAANSETLLPSKLVQDSGVPVRIRLICTPGLDPVANVSYTESATAFSASALVSLSSTFRARLNLSARVSVFLCLVIPRF